jgi:hypothetical protein
MRTWQLLLHSRQLALLGSLGGAFRSRLVRFIFVALGGSVRVCSSTAEAW